MINKAQSTQKQGWISWGLEKLGLTSNISSEKSEKPKIKGMVNPEVFGETPKENKERKVESSEKYKSSFGEIVDEKEDSHGKGLE